MRLSIDLGSIDRIRHSLYVVLLCAAVVHVIWQMLIAVPVLWERDNWNLDILHFYSAAERVWQGERLYWPWPEFGPHILTSGVPYPHDRHPYPPFVAPALAPLTIVPYLDFARLVNIPLLVSFWTYAACIAMLATGRITVKRVIIAGLVLAMLPGSYLAIGLGQIDPILWALFGAALVLPRLRGAGFAISAMVKLYCAWPLLLAWRHEGRRIVFPAAVAGLSGVAVGMLVMGPVAYIGAVVDWARYMLPVVGQGTFNPFNVSVSFAGLRLLTELGWEYVPGPLPTWARIYLTTMSIGAPMIAAWLIRRRERVLQYAVVTCVAVLFSPLCWTTYLPLLLAPAAILFRARFYGIRTGETFAEAPSISEEATSSALVVEAAAPR